MKWDIKSLDCQGFAVNSLYKLIEMINLITKLKIFAFLTQFHFLGLWLKGKNKRENPMNIKDFTNSTKDNKISSQKRNVFLFGIASILFATTGIHDVLAKPNSTTLQSQMMPQQGMMMQNMIAGEKTDRHFIEMMMPHHEGAVQMANLALKLSKRPEIRKLAESIKSDQTRESAQMKSWYKQWYGAEVPSTMTMMNQGDMMDMAKPMGTPMTKPVGMPITKPMGMPMGMQNMMAVDLKALETAPNFDQAFIKEMIPHHKMALMMSSMIVDSDRPEMRTLSREIVQAQSTEIEQMRQWYKAWYK